MKKGGWTIDLLRFRASTEHGYVEVHVDHIHSTGGDRVQWWGDGKLGDTTQLSDSPYVKSGVEAFRKVFERMVANKNEEEGERRRMAVGIALSKELGVLHRVREQARKMADTADGRYNVRVLDVDTLDELRAFKREVETAYNEAVVRSRVAAGLDEKTS